LGLGLAAGRSLGRARGGVGWEADGEQVEAEAGIAERKWLRLVGFGWCYRGGAGLSVADMATTTSAKAARKAARESALEANADLARRTKLNVEDLTKFFTAMSRADGVDDWLDAKVAALKAQAARRRDAERRDAGVALAAMRRRGEQVREIARLARIGEKQVRELIRHAETTPGVRAEPPEGGAAASEEPSVTAVGADAAEARGDGRGSGAVEGAGLGAVGA
jgi:poly-gamma-glutamate capsule biosynthesis protein CapA/YwtB (metallophosphatase superfamily)